MRTARPEITKGRWKIGPRHSVLHDEMVEARRRGKVGRADLRDYELLRALEARKEVVAGPHWRWWASALVLILVAASALFAHWALLGAAATLLLCWRPVQHQVARLSGGVFFPGQQKRPRRR